MHGKNAKIMILKILTHSMADSVTSFDKLNVFGTSHQCSFHLKDLPVTYGIATVQ